MKSHCPGDLWEYLLGKPNGDSDCIVLLRRLSLLDELTRLRLVACFRQSMNASPSQMTPVLDPIAV